MKKLFLALAFLFGVAFTSCNGSATKTDAVDTTEVVVVVDSVDCDSVSCDTVTVDSVQ